VRRGRSRVRTRDFGLWTLDSGQCLHPRSQILLKTFLRFQAVGDDNDGASWKKLVEQRGEKRLSGRRHAGAGQRSALLHAPRQRPHSGSLCDVSEQAACRRRCRVLRQAGGRMLRIRVESRSANRFAYCVLRQVTDGHPVGHLTQYATRNPRLVPKNLGPGSAFSPARLVHRPFRSSPNSRRS
jgi:hypothetical protein